MFRHRTHPGRRVRLGGRTISGRLMLAVSGAATIPLVLASCGTSGSTASTPTSRDAASAAGGTLVIDSTFDLKTADPARSYEFTGELLAHNVYEHATTFAGTDLTKPVPQLTDFAWSSDHRTLTLTLHGEHHFVDGTPVTAADIAFSYQRVQGIKGSPAFLLDGVTVTQVDDSTVTLTTKAPDLALPAILANPSLGIVEKSLVVDHGGTTTPQDGAETFLNTESAGSAAYQIASLDINSQIVLDRNPHYDGPKPKWDKIVVANTKPATQKLNVASGQAQIALDISPDDAKTLGTGETKVVHAQSGFTVYTFFAADQEHGKTVDDPKFWAAARHAINYDHLLNLAGPGSVQPGGVVPVQFPGSLAHDPANTFDPQAAKKLLAESDYHGEPIDYLYASDVTVQGLNLGLIAQTIQSDLKSVGINLKLDPEPASTYYSTLRANKAQAALAYWGPDFPDASNYLAFTPGEVIAVRANWTADSPTGKQVGPFVTAATSAGTDTRNKTYQALQTELNKVGPLIPLLQPAQSVVTSSSLTGIVPSPLWLLDLATIR